MLAAPAGTFLRVVHLVWASSMKAKFAFAALLVACAVSITGCHGDPFASFDRRASLADWFDCYGPTGCSCPGDAGCDTPCSQGHCGSR